MTPFAAQVPPRLTSLAHQAYLGIKFNDNGTEAWNSMVGWYLPWDSLENTPMVLLYPGIETFQVDTSFR